MKYKSFRFIALSLFGVLLLGLKCYSQLEIPQVVTSNVIPPSPQMRAFQIYGDIPVSYSTGVPDISIPLHTLVSGNIKIPIVLRYHTHSVKPFDSNSGNVALGWIVEYGGNINRSVVGAKDEILESINTARIFNENNPDDYIYLASSEWGYSSADYQSDWFNYSLPTGETARFFLNRKSDSGVFNQQFDYFLYPNTEAKIDATQIGSFNWFKVTDSKGFAYEFGNAYTESYDEANITGWMLYHVMDPFSGKNVSYSYTPLLLSSENYNRFASPHSVLFDEDPRATTTVNANNAFNLGIYENENLHPYGYCSHSPNDLTVYHLENNCMGAKKIDCVMPQPTHYQIQVVKSITNGVDSVCFYYYQTSGFGQGDKLSRITVKSGSEIVKEIVFDTDHFPDQVGALRLKSLAIYGKNGSPAEIYRFEYNGYWQNKASDYWGFYSNNLNTRTSPFGDYYTQKLNLIYTKLNGGAGPNYFDIYDIKGPLDTITVGSTDFSSDWNSNAENCLTKIIYPTGGYSQFEYEKGTYLNSSGETCPGGGPRIKSITDYSSDGKSKKRTFSYTPTYIQINPVTDIGAFMKEDMEVKTFPGINMSPPPPPGLDAYIVKRRTISNQPHWGLSLDVLYPKVEVKYENGSNSFYEQYEYHAGFEHTISYNGDYMMVDKFFANPLRGKLLRKSSFNHLHDSIQTEEYAYAILNRAVVNNLHIVSNVNGVYAFGNRESILLYCGTDFLPTPNYSYKYYQINVPNVNLIKKTVTGFFNQGKNKRTEDFEYLAGSDVRIKNHSMLNSDGKNTNINYSYIDSTTYNGLYHKNMLELKSEVNYTAGTGRKKIKYEYNPLGLVMNTASAQVTTGQLPETETRISYTYDLKGNIQSETMTGHLPVCFVWGYDYTFPVARIEGLTLQQVSTMLGSTLVDIGICKDLNLMKALLNVLRSKLNDGLVTTYVYDNVMGTLTEVQEPNGAVKKYMYDGLGRLKQTSVIQTDNAEKTIQTFDYHYKQ